MGDTAKKRSERQLQKVVPLGREHHQYKTVPRYESISYNTCNSGGQRRQEPVSWDDLDDAIEEGIRTSLRDVDIRGDLRDQERRGGRRNNGYQPYGPAPVDHEMCYGNNATAGEGGGDPVSWDDLGDAIEHGLRDSVQDLEWKVIKKQEIGFAGKESKHQNNFDRNPWMCAVCTVVNENGEHLSCKVCNHPRT